MYTQKYTFSGDSCVVYDIEIFNQIKENFESVSTKLSKFHPSMELFEDWRTIFVYFKYLISSKKVDLSFCYNKWRLWASTYGK